MKILFKLPNLFAALRIRFWTIANPVILRNWGGVTLGHNAIIPGKVHLSGGGRVSIGSNFYFSSGDGVNPICSNIHGAIHVEKDATLVVGDNVGMSSTRIWAHTSIRIGNHVNIGGCVFITDTDAHPISWQHRRAGGEGTLSAPVVIEDDVWIGAHAIVLKGVTIGARSVIGAGSVVTHSIPPDSIAAGNPCRVIKKLNDSL